MPRGVITVSTPSVSRVQRTGFFTSRRVFSMLAAGLLSSMRGFPASSDSEIIARV